VPYHIIITLTTPFQSSQHFSTLSRLSLAEIPLSAKTMGYLCRLLEVPALHLSHLDLSKCEIKTDQIKYLCQYLPISNTLTHLVLGSNVIGVDGEEMLAEALTWTPPPASEEGEYMCVEDPHKCQQMTFLFSTTCPYTHTYILVDLP